MSLDTYKDALITQAQSLIAGATSPDDAFALSKIVAALQGTTAVQDVIDESTTQQAAVQAEGATQIAAVTAAGAAVANKLEALSAMESVAFGGGA